jgi:hypothetical protein
MDSWGVPREKNCQTSTVSPAELGLPLDQAIFPTIPRLERPVLRIWRMPRWTWQASRSHALLSGWLAQMFSTDFDGSHVRGRALMKGGGSGSAMAPVTADIVRPIGLSMST